MNFHNAIHSNRCWVENTFQEATVFFENEIISKIEIGSIHNNENCIDVGDYILMPGIIDAHVHVNEPGRTEWEGFDTATKAAAAGGITTIVDMPLNAKPVTTSEKAFKEKLESTKNKLHVNCGFYGGLIPDNLSDLENLMKAGVLGIKCFLIHSGIDDFSNVAGKEIREAMPVIAKYNLPLLVHCELTENEFQHDLSVYPYSYRKYLESRPKKWENDAIALVINLCRKYRCKTHIVHVSSAEALDLIRNAKEEGLPLTAETCPHYLYFYAENIPDRNTLYKCAPPIREKANNNLLKEGLVGTRHGLSRQSPLDFITTDHSPATPELKEIKSGNLQKAWGGIAGLQFLLPASWTSLKNSMVLETFIPLLTSHPAQFLNIHHRKGHIKAGYDADFTIWSPDKNFTVTKEIIHHRHKITPYMNEKLDGVIRQTYVNGKPVYADGKIIHKNAGHLIFSK